MRIKKSFICLTLRQGTKISIIVDLLKILITVGILITYISTGYDSGTKLASSAVQTPQQLTDGTTETKTLLNIVVIFIGDIARYSVVGVMGLVMVYKKWSTIFIGTYFWVKCLSSFLNIFASLLMVTLVQLPFTDMILSISSFVLDQYFCLIIYSFWQNQKDIDEYVIQNEEEAQNHPVPGSQDVEDEEIQQSPDVQIDQNIVNQDDDEIQSSSLSNRQINHRDTHSTLD